MKKMIKFLPLVVFPSLIVVACANAQTSDKTSQDTIVNSSDNANGITEYTVHVDFHGGLYEGKTKDDFTVRRGVYYEYFKKTLPVAADITYPNHELAYYSFADTPQTEIGDDYRFYGEVTIVAQYTTTGEEREIKWENYDGTELAVEKYHDGEMPVYPGEEPTHEPEPGKIFTFAGWDPKISIVTANQTYKAQFDVEVNESVVTFDTRGGNYIPAKIVIYNGTISKAEKATRTGYVATDVWYYKDTAGAEQTFKFGTGPSATKVTNDMTLYCRWEEVNKYNATFEPDGGTWSDDDTEAKTMPTEFGKIPSLGELTISKDGYTFAGWKRASDEGIGLVPMTEKGETYTAQWNHNDCTVFFDTKGGTSVPSQTVAYDGTIENAPTTPTKEGYVFDKPEGKSGWWYKDATDKEHEFIFGDAGTHVTSDITVYCKWTLDKVTISFDANEGTWSGTAEQTIDVDVDYGSIPAPDKELSRPGYTFKGWDKEIVPATTATTYVAQWGDPEIYTVTYNSGEGSQYIEPDTAKYGETIEEEPSKPTREGYNFDGWYTTKTYDEGTRFIFGPKEEGGTPVTSNITLYAKWDKIDAVTLEFVIDDSDQEFVSWHCDDPEDDVHQSTQMIEFGEDDIDPTADVVIGDKHYVWTIDADHVLAGWRDEETLAVYKTIPAAKKDASYIAVIEDAPVSTVSVTFNSKHDDGTGEIVPYIFLTENIKKGDCAIEPKKEPINDLYKMDFVGWYTKPDGEGGTKFNFDNPVNDNINVYAHFEDAETIKVNLVDHSGNSLGQSEEAIGHEIIAPKAKGKVPYWFVNDARIGGDGWKKVGTQEKVTALTKEDTGATFEPFGVEMPFDVEINGVAADTGKQFTIDGGHTSIVESAAYGSLINYSFDEDAGLPDHIKITTVNSSGDEEEMLPEFASQYYINGKISINSGTTGEEDPPKFDFRQIKSIKITVYENA